RTVHRITLRVRTPVVVPDRLRGNLLTTHDRVLGTGLLPAILERIPRRLGLDDIQITDAVPAALVGDRFVPAHPAPLVWHSADKGEGSVMFNLAAKAAPPTAKAKPAKSRIVQRADGTWVAVRPGVTDRTHAVIDDEARRPVESAGGGLFTFQGIPAGTVLVTDVVLPGGVDLDLPTGHLLRLGRSRKDDFGLVEALSVDVLTEPAPALGEPGPDGSRRLTVWCLSDVLLRSATLAPDPTPEGLAAALATALTDEAGPVRLDVVRAPEGDDRRPTATAATRREGFAVRWGRPRPSQVALAGGSVVTLEVTGGSVTADALARVERDGIGDRRAEGFGRVRFNLPDLDEETLELVRKEPPEPPGQVPLPPTTAPPALRHALRTAWRTAIRRRVEELAASSNLLDLLLPGSDPTDSQLGGLRAQLGRNPRDVRDWFAGLRASQNRSDSWKPSAIDAAEAFLLDDGPPAVAALASRPPTVWQILGMASGWDAEGDRSDGTPSAEVLRLREEMTAEARALLLVAMHRQPRGDSASLTEPAGELTEPTGKDT
ncbi:MAG: CRISPR-associated protein Csx10, partial [Actinomycetota bacterium]|nr:CRISPR-associated protein Csx10 [Actinomycetota bacterium]